MPSSFRQKGSRRYTPWQGIQWHMAIFATLADNRLQLQSCNRNMHIQGSHLRSTASETPEACRVFSTHRNWGTNAHQEVKDARSAVVEFCAAESRHKLLVDADVFSHDDQDIYPSNTCFCTQHEGSHVPCSDGHDGILQRHPIYGDRDRINCDSRQTHAITCPSDAHSPDHTNVRNSDGYGAGTHRNLPSFEGSIQDIDIVSLLQGTISLRHCKIIHAYILEIGLIGDVYLVNLVLKVYSKFGTVLDARALFDAMPRPNTISWNTIISAYVHCNALEEARMLFSGMLRRNVVSWNTLIAAYARQEKAREAILLFWRLHQECESPNDVTFINVLCACSKSGELDTGKLIHIFINGCGLGSSLTIGTALVNMYAKCKDLNSAYLAFGELHQHDVVLWTSLISAYAKVGDGEVALLLFGRMQQEGVEPNKLTFLSILSACANSMSLFEGKALHACMSPGSVKLDADIASALINLYGKCGCMKHASLVFESVAQNATCVWNAMMAACIEHSLNRQALSVYKEMLNKGLKLDACSFASALSACGCLMDLDLGLHIHSFLVEEGIIVDVILSNTLINFFTKCKALEDASFIFEKMQFRSVVTWTCMIAAYAQEGHYRPALELFYQMHLEDARSNDVTIATALGACADSISLEEGRTLHTWIAHERKEFGPTVSNALVNMYGKCGSLKDASFVFRHCHTDNVVPRNAMMASYAYGGLGKEALTCVFKMQREGLEPDELTLVSLLSACSHAGMVDEGNCYVYFVLGDPHISLMLEHCVCIVDLLGRAGQLAEARSFVDKVPFLPDSCLWSALHAAFKMHGSRIWARRVSKCLLELDRY